MLKKILLIGILCFWSSGAIAIAVTLEPDDFLQGTDLSSISPYVSMSTTGGAPVYAAPIVGVSQELPPGITGTGPFNQQVFSIHHDKNSEWYAWPDAAGIQTDPYDPAQWAMESHGLRLNFHVPVNHVSLLGLELFAETGAEGSDPIRWWVYDSNNLLLYSGYKDSYPSTGSIGYHPEDHYHYSYWEMQFSHPDIATVIVGGESEPTTLDRLVFNTTPVPEPSTITLFALGMIGLTQAFRCRKKKS